MTQWHEIPPRHHALPPLAAAIPVLNTERLTLRGPMLEDFPLLVEINESVAELSQREGAGRRDGAWQDFAQMTATWVWRSHGWWTVCDTGGPCGFVGLGFEPGDRCPELGYLFAAEARGKGYATEAATAARDFARAELKLDALVSYISDGNDASQGVARKLGAMRDATAEAELGLDGVQVWRHWAPAEV